MRIEDIYALFLILMGVIILPFIAQKLKISIFSIELLYGLILSEFGVNLNFPIIEYLAYLGFIFLLFNSGSLLNFSKENLKDPYIFIVPTIILILTFIITLLFKLPFIYFIILSALSAGSITKTLKDSRKINTKNGQTLLRITSIGEFISIILIVIYRFYFKGISLISAIFSLALFLSIALTIIFILKWLIWWYPDFFEKLTTDNDRYEFGVRFSLMLTFFLIGLSFLLHIEPFFAAFISGIILSFIIRKKGQISIKFSGIGYGFFIPIFLIKTGNEIILASANLFLLIKIVIFLIIIWLIRFISISFKYSNIKETTATAFLLSSPFTAIIAFVEMTKIEHLNVNNNIFLLLLALIAEIIFPVVAEKLSEGKSHYKKLEVTK